MDSESRKRQHSGDERNVEENDEESKRQRIAGKGIATNNKDNGTPDPIRTTKPVSDHSSTTRPRRDSELGAVGGEKTNFGFIVTEISATPRAVKVAVATLKQ